MKPRIALPPAGDLTADASVFTGVTADHPPNFPPLDGAAPDFQSKQFWADAAPATDIQSPEFWSGAQVMDAPHNTVFDENNSRTVALPQTLNAAETDYVIKRDADEVKNFFGMQDVGGFEALGKGVQSFAAAQPQAAGGILLNMAEQTAAADAAHPQARAQGLAAVDQMESLPVIGGMFKWAQDMGAKALENGFSSEGMVERAQALIDRNKKYMADAGLERPPEGGLSGVLYDIGQGMSSMLSSVGLAALTRSPETAGLYFGALQKSSIYQEARAAGKTPEQAGDISSVAGLVEGGLEFVGLDHFIKSFKGNSAAARFVNGAAIEFTQEASQQAGEESITQLTSVRKDKPFLQTVGDILYNGLLGGVLGGMSSAAVGSFVKDQATQKGMNEDTAAKLGAYAAKNADLGKQNMGEFIDKELAPIAKDDKSAQEFMTLMQSFGNDKTLVNRDSLDPSTRAAFDQWVDIFNQSTVAQAGGAGEVEKAFFDTAKAAGVSEDVAAANAKNWGQVATKLSRVWGISPKQWYDLHGPEAITVEQAGQPMSAATQQPGAAPADAGTEAAVAALEKQWETQKSPLAEKAPPMEAKPAGPEFPKNIYHGAFASKVRPIGVKGEKLFRETGFAVDQLLQTIRTHLSGGQWSGFLTNNEDIALGQHGNTGAKLTFKGDYISGDEHIKPMTGDLAGREYKADYLAKGGLEKVQISEKAWERLQRGKTATAEETVKALENNFDMVKQGTDVIFYSKQEKPAASQDAATALGDEIMFQPQGQTAAAPVRAQVTFRNGQRPIINLFKAADESSLLHESAHIWLREFKAAAAVTKDPRIRRDYQTLTQWMGAKGGRLTVKQEEKFARGIEQYFRDGRAPTAEMQPVFDRFKQWLTQIYKSAGDLKVNLTPEVQRVFDKLLGGEFTQSAAAPEAAARSTEDQTAVNDDYAANRAALAEKEKNGIGKSFVNWGSDAFTPVSARLGRIHASLKHALRRFVFDVGVGAHLDREAIKPFVEKTSAMSEDDYKDFDFALKNRDAAKIDEIVRKYGMEADYAAVREMLDRIHIEAQDVGIDLGYLENYFPRQVTPGKAGEFLAEMRGQPFWGDIQLAMHAQDPKGAMTQEEQAAFVNQFLRGQAPTDKVILAAKSFTKDRPIDWIKPEWNKYYEDSMQTLIRYVGAMRHGIESRKLFGKSEAETDANIGQYVLGLVRDGVISAEQEGEVKRIFKSVVEPATGAYAWIKWAKNSTYVYTMGSPISALTQLQDFASSWYEHGLLRAASSVGRSLTGKTVLGKADLGLENLLQEFETEELAQGFIRKMFKAAGVTWTDTLFSDAFIDAGYRQLQAQAKAGKGNLNDMLDEIYGDKAEDVRNDVVNGNMTEDVKYLLFSELSDTRPVSLAEMPLHYLNAPNGRILYMLKTYSLKQIDMFRREALDDMFSGDVGRTATGARRLVGLAMSLMLTGMGSDALKDLILGRDFEVSDLVVDNLFKLAGFSKYTIYKAKKAGLEEAVWGLIVPPVLTGPADALNDVVKISGGDRPVKDARVLGHVPIVGKFYYWWWGGGHDKK